MRGVDFDQFILNMVNVALLPKRKGKRTFELELALKTRSYEVTLSISLLSAASKSLSKVMKRLSLAQGRGLQAQTKVEGEGTMEDMLQFGHLCQKIIYYANK